MPDADIVIDGDEVRIKNGHLTVEELLKATDKLLAKVGAELSGTLILRDGVLVYEGDDNFPVWQLDNGSPPNVINWGGGDIVMCGGDVVYNDNDGNRRGLIDEVKKLRAEVEQLKNS